MHIGLIDVDSHNFPNLALMKISAYHKKHGDQVEWCTPLMPYDIVYQSKVFDDTYSPDIDYIPNAKKVIKGGTGYNMSSILPPEIEKQFPDYSIYPELTKDTAYGYLTRGCPRNCHFCIVSSKEGRKSRKVADLNDFWNGQKNIKLLDPNILACREHISLLSQLIGSQAYVDFTQGIDARLLTAENIGLINMKEEKAILEGLMVYSELATHKPHGKYGAVYVLTNYDTNMGENLYRIYTLRDMGFDPYVMIYDKPNAPKTIRLLQRWCNNKIIFNSEPNFEKYNPKKG